MWRSSLYDCHVSPLGVVLAVVSHGGLLLATNQITPGSLMSFLVATQTVQRSVALGQSVSCLVICPVGHLLS